MKINADQIVTVNTLSDIKSAIQEFLPSSTTAPEVHSTIKAEGKTYKLSAPTSCGYRDMLIEGFGIVKKRLEAKNPSQNAELGIDPVSVDGHMWLDELIGRRLGGKRDGVRVRWDVVEGTFYFDPFSGKLTKCS